MADEILKTEETKPTGMKVTNPTDTINQMYDTQLQSQKAGLEAAMNQSLSDQQAAADKIAPAYQQSANDLATQYERNRMNFNASALANGINTGAYSQADLARNSEYQRDFANLRGKELEATAEAQRQMANTKANYQLQIQQAIADNDTKRANALLTQYKEDQKKGEDNAKLLASTGDFSGYYNYYVSQGYSPAEAQRIADSMRSYWIASNAKTAYGMGMIDGTEYDRITNPKVGSSSGRSYVAPTNGGSGGTGGTGTTSGTGSVFSIDQLTQAKKDGQTAEQLGAYLSTNGYSKEQIDATLSVYNNIKTAR